VWVLTIVQLSVSVPFWDVYICAWKIPLGDWVSGVHHANCPSQFCCHWFLLAGYGVCGWWVPQTQRPLNECQQLQNCSWISVNCLLLNNCKLRNTHSAFYSPPWTLYKQKMPMIELRVHLIPLQGECIMVFIFQRYTWTSHLLQFSS
jgi:hypothetical protein